MDIALITLIVTTASALFAQILAMVKTDRAAKLQADMFRSEAEERRKDAAILIEQTKAEALLLSAQTEKHARELATRTEQNRRDLKVEVQKIAEQNVAVAATQTEEIKSLVAEATVLTKDGTQAAKDAYHEANQVNLWRTEVNDEIRKLARSVEKMLAGQNPGPTPPAAPPPPS